jgi:hypothetical protein
MMAKPLHTLTSDIPWNWNDKCDETFKKLKKVVGDRQVLALPNDKGKFQLKTNTSKWATGTVLSQAQEDGRFKPVLFNSQLMKPCEQNYNNYNKELLEIMKVDEWRALLVIKPFEILTDHWSLTYYKHPQKLSK